MDDLNEGFGQSTHRKHAAQMGFALPGAILDTGTDVRADSGESDDGGITLFPIHTGGLTSPPPPGVYGDTYDRDDAEPEYVSPTRVDIRQPTQPDFSSREGVGGDMPVAPRPSESPAAPLPDKPEVLPTGAAFSADGIACFVYTVAQVPEVFGTPGLPASIDPTCAALVLHADDDWDGDLGDAMMGLLLQLATQEADPSTVWNSDFDALRHLANRGALLVGPQFCDAEQVLLSYLAPGVPYEDYDVDSGTAEEGDKGLMTGLIVAGALAAYYFLSEG
jgi:hypothetical protein